MRELHLYKHEMDADINHASGLYLRSRLKQIEEQIDKLALEDRAIRNILPLVDAVSCSECHGQKSFWVYTSSDDGYSRPCDTCKGTGEAQ